MQTFLPFPLDFEATARCLDDRRLGKQRVECLQILQTITKIRNTNTDQRKSTPWANHPAVKMWEDHAYELKLYATAICNEWIARGFQDTVLEKLKSIPVIEYYIPPTWLSNKAFARSHQSNLLRKAHEDVEKAKTTKQRDVAMFNLTRYKEAFLQDPNNNGVLPPLDLPYVWPVQ